VLRQERSSFGYAFAGLAHVWRTQPHLRIHAGIALLAIGMGLFIGLGTVEWAVLVVMIAVVITLELLNTVLEVIVDMITPSYHPKAKIAKDVAAGAVLVAAAAAVAVGGLLFVPRFVALLAR
jgi:diacylglycerol kinase (ATP)